MSILDLIENIVAGKLNESNISFKSALSEKIAQKLEEKKLSGKQKKLDKNRNGKLDSDDFKQIRGEKDHCCSEETEQLHPAVKQFASIQHENWRKSFDPENKGTERIKDNGDGTSGNINVPFDQLHPTWQKENIEAGKAALEAVKKHPNNMEEAAERVHDEWMKRNPKRDWNASQHVPYKDLPEDEKDKDREHVKTMVGLLSNKTKTEQYNYSLESQLAEVLNPDQGVKAYIDDFLDSDNSRFKGKSKEQRRKMAIAAFYAAKKK